MHAVPHRASGVLIMVEHALKCAHRLCILGLITLSGCITLAPEGEAFREYAERVFREQNQVTDEIMWRMPDIEVKNPDLATQLAQAEMEMFAACEPLNELAILYRDQQKPGLIKKFSSARSVRSCDQATQSATTLLDRGSLP